SLSHTPAPSYLGLTGFVLATAFGILMYSSLGESLQYYKYVDEVMAEPAAWHGKNLQVHGVVVPDSIGRKDNTLEWRFQLQRNGKVLTAYYNGIVPDTFKADSEVALTGTMAAKGFHATKMPAKCPSKYAAAPAGPAAKTATPAPLGGA